MKKLNLEKWVLGFLAGMLAMVGVAEEREPILKEGARLLFIGDSITDMNRGRNERDRNHYLGHSFVYLIAARVGVEMPEAKLEFFNRGVSGNRVGQLKERWAEDAIAMKPDVLTVLVGTNDVGKGIGAEEFERDYREILSASRAANPKLEIILIEPFVLWSEGLGNEPHWKERRAKTEELAEAVEKLADEFGAKLIHGQKLFDEATQNAPPEYWMWDGIHPLPQGHELLAREWERVVGE
jgi:lysophospholipase L1-like esterase